MIDLYVSVRPACAVLNVFTYFRRYFTERSGELINDGRFRVIRTVGKGVFSKVVICDVVNQADRVVMGEKVAVKIIRGNEVMRKAGRKELAILREVRLTKSLRCP